MLHHLLRRPLHHDHHHHHHQQFRPFIDARLPWVRDRALDHAVEKEKHLLPFHNLKDLLIISSPTPSLSLSSISSASSFLRLPFRPIRFLRLFPSSFLEHLPSINPNPTPTLTPTIPHPHFSPSPHLLTLHQEEQLLYPSCRAETADRLLRLLMLCPGRKIPLKIIDRLRWDLGLPRDFVKSLLPDYPDYFQIVEGDLTNELDLELVCYRKDLAVSEMERYAMKTGGYKKGMALSFPQRFSRGFEMEKKVRKWVEDFQKLPYVSPYEEGSRLPSKSGVWEKWAVGMMHEFLCLTVPKKTEKDSLEMVARYLGLPAGFRKMVLNYPGIFYLSNKLRTQTVVLREAYRRDLLVEKHPLMGMRYQYIHLMRKEKEGSIDSRKKRKKLKLKREGKRTVGEFDDGEREGKEDYDGDEVDNDEEEVSGVSDFDSEDEESNDEESDDDDEDEEDYYVGQENVRQGSRGIQVENFEPRRPIDRRQANYTRRNDRNVERNVGGRSHGNGNSQRSRGRLNTRKRVSM